jgi:hypothetical protein
MKPQRLLSLVIVVPVLLSSQTVRAEGASEPPSTREAESYDEPAVVVGADGGLAAFVGGARSRVGAEPGTVLHIHAGYRLSNGIEPRLSFSYVDFSRIADSHPRIATLAPGCRWWIPVSGRVRPWVGAHLGLGRVQSQSGDVTGADSYWNIGANGGIDIMLTRNIAVGTTLRWTYSDIVDRPRDQPIPTGYTGPVERTSYSLGWLTMSAGMAFFL